MSRPSVQSVLATSFVFFLFLMVATVSSAIRISNCDNTQTVEYLEGRDNPDNLDIRCYGSGDTTSTITWTLLDNTGTTKHLATCEGLNNCTTTYSLSALRVYWWPAAYSRISLPSIGREFSGTFTCTETNRTTTESATCAVKVTRARFQSCREGTVLIEGYLGYFYCDHSYYTPRRVSWTLTTSSGQVLDLGSCSNSSDCTSPQGSDTRLTMDSGYSRLYIDSVFFQRSLVRQLSCSFSHNHTTDVDTCPVEVYHPPTLGNCSSDVSRGNWSFVIFCDVTQFWSSRDRYEFRVLEVFEVKRRDAACHLYSFTFEGRRSFRGSLSPYTDPGNNKQYYRGRLSYSWPISPVPGTYSDFRLDTYPNGQSTYIPHTLSITSPAKPTHNCTDHSLIRGKEEVPCVCSTDYLGSPEGRLIWLLGDSAMATGAYGVKDLRFPSEKLTNGHNGMVARCELDWVKPLTVSLPFVLNVNITDVPTLGNCSSDVSRSNWSFLVFCDVTKFLSSMGPYEFLVQEKFSVKKMDTIDSANTYTFKGRRSFGGSLSPYTDPGDNKQYYRGRLSYSWPISPVPGTYFGFRLYAYPDGQYAYIPHTLSITSPAKPTHNCTDHSFIRGKEEIPCFCSTDYLGSPEGRLIWLLGDSAMTTGAYGIKDLRFPNEKLTTGHNGMTARCELDWVKPLTVSLPFVLNVNITVQQQQSLQQSDETLMKGVAIAGWTSFAVVVVAFVAVVVIVLIKRRGRRGTCCCMDDTYDHPNRRTNNDDGHYSDLDVTQSARETGKNKGNTPKVTERVYQNMAMGQEGHM